MSSRESLLDSPKNLINWQRINTSDTRFECDVRMLIAALSSAPKVCRTLAAPSATWRVVASAASAALIAVVLFAGFNQGVTLVDQPQAVITAPNSQRAPAVSSAPQSTASVGNTQGATAAINSPPPAPTPTVSPAAVASTNYIVQVNDLFPQSAAIIASLKKQNIQLSGTFGSTSSGNRTKPDKLVIVVGSDFPIDILQKIIKICLDNGLDGLQLLLDQREFNAVVIGSFAYEGYTQITEQIKNQLISSSLTWPQLIQLVAVSVPKYTVQVNDLFPQSAQIIASLKNQNIQLSPPFGSTSIGNRTKPDKFVVAIGPQFPIYTFQKIFSVCIENGLDGLTIISGQPNFYSIYIGAFAYEPYTPITEKLKSDLLSSSLTWPQLRQLVAHADQ